MLLFVTSYALQSPDIMMMYVIMASGRVVVSRQHLASWWSVADWASLLLTHILAYSYRHLPIPSSLTPYAVLPYAAPRVTLRTPVAVS